MSNLTLSRYKEEIIEKLAEEKVRSILYGNPLDIFEKDKAKLGFGTFFKDLYQDKLIQFEKEKC